MERERERKKETFVRKSSSPITFPRAISPNSIAYFINFPYINEKALGLYRYMRLMESWKEVEGGGGLGDSSSTAVVHRSLKTYWIPPINEIVRLSKESICNVGHHTVAVASTTRPKASITLIKSKTNDTRRKEDEGKEEREEKKKVLYLDNSKTFPIVKRE